MKKKTMKRLGAGAAVIAAGCLIAYNWSRISSLSDSLQSRKCPPPPEAVEGCKDGSGCHPLPVKDDQVCDSYHGEDRPEREGFSLSDCGVCGDGIHQRSSNRFSPPHDEHGVNVQYVVGRMAEDERTCEADTLCGNGIIDKPRLVSMFVPDLDQDAGDALVPRAVLIYERCNGNKEKPWDLQHNPQRLYQYELISYCKADCEPSDDGTSVATGALRADGGKPDTTKADAGETAGDRRGSIGSCPDQMTNPNFSASAIPVISNIHQAVKQKNDVLWYTLASSGTGKVKIQVSNEVDSSGRITDVSLSALCDGRSCGSEGKLWQVLSRFRHTVLNRDLESPGVGCRFTVSSDLVKPVK